ncbi:MULTISPECIES: hypothetical protein [unclassified Shewanella]|uniref:hypothetical protein n=1 Tax=unclassified Shewanella TaxID=196818 RepID=UPI0039B5D98B
MNSNFEIIEQLFNDKKLVFDDNYLSSINLSEIEFSNIFPPADYPSQEFCNGRGSVCCDEIDYVFHDIYDYIKSINKESIDELTNSPKKIITKDGVIHDVFDFKVSFKNWMLLFKKLASHKYFNSYDTYIFIEKKAINTSTVLEIDIDSFSKNELIDLIKNIDSPSLLLDSCLSEDAHQGERISTMKTSLTTLINEVNLNFVKILCSADVLLDNYHKAYETYLRSFSFDEFIKELEDDVGTFISKVEEQIQGFYVQALAVPGAVILASAFRGIEKGVSISLLFSTFLAIIIVFTSLKSKIKFIERITKNTLAKLHIYRKKTDEIENHAAQSSILEKIADAIKSVNDTSKESKKDIYKMRDIIIAMGIFYIIAVIVFGKL